MICHYYISLPSKYIPNWYRDAVAWSDDLQSSQVYHHMHQG